MASGLILVAHPDDEVLFAGELLLRHPDVEWDLVCATHHTESPRGQRFQASIAEFVNRGVRIRGGLSLGLFDTGPVLTHAQYLSWRGRARAVLAELGRHDIVVTHNKMGEYGHGHHMALHQIAREWYGVDFWSFVCSAPSGVGPQQQLAHGMSFIPGPEKHVIMSTIYGAEEEAMLAHHPRVIESQFYLVGVEHFTSNAGAWPL